jgi:hypothetical protein
VIVDLLFGEHGTGLVLPGRIPDPGREVADDEHGRMSVVLEGFQLAEDDRPPQRDVVGRRVQSELHPQRPADLQLVGEAVGRDHLGGVPGERVYLLVGGERHESPSTPDRL